MFWTLQTLSDFPDRLRGAYVVVGNFDGVHRGHRDLLQRASKFAEIDDRFLVALTFDPHPRSVLTPRAPFLQLTSHEEKCRLLKEAGVDDVVTLAFDAELASLWPSAFVELVLAEHMAAKAIVAGQNFCFGLNRAGSIAELAQVAPDAGLSVHIVPPLCSMDGGEIITSELIRSRLSIGDIKGANHLLGRRWTIEGEVVHGDKRGRQLGFPTANLAPNHNAQFGFGIYAVRVLLNGEILNGVAC